jgi:hypothetical protein
MVQLDFTRVCGEVMTACTDLQISAANLTRFALLVWMTEGHFALRFTKELDSDDEASRLEAGVILTTARIDIIKRRSKHVVLCLEDIKGGLDQVIDVCILDIQA